MSLTGYQKHAIDRQVLQMDEKIIFGNEQNFFFLYYYYYSPSAVRRPPFTVHRPYIILLHGPKMKIPIIYTEVYLVYEF